MSIVKRSCAVHDGVFHADEVTACALLLFFNQIDKDKIVRTRDKEQQDLCEFVCDVGGVYDPSIKRFDHHQVDYKGSLSSAGMICRWLSDAGHVAKELTNFLSDQFVQGVDEQDNGIYSSPKGQCSFSDLIDNFAPPAYEAHPQELLNCFFKAVDFAKAHIERLIARYYVVYASLRIVEKAMEAQSGLLEFSQAMPWTESFFALGGETHPAQFVLMPVDDQWKLRAIPPTGEDKMGVRRAHPTVWAGLRDAELEKVSGINGAVFCHKGLFISIWKTKEAARQAYKKIIEIPSQKPLSTIFGKIIKREIEADIVFENHNFIVIKDKFPQAPIHLLIIPKKEVKDLQALEKRDASLMANLLLVAQEMAVQFKIEKGYRLLTNCGAEAGQSIFHLHFHLMGWNGA